MPSILIVDDDELVLESLKMVLDSCGHKVYCAEGVSRAADFLNKVGFDLVITDLKMLDGSGLDVLDMVKQKDPNLPTIVITAYATVQTAVEAMKKGAYDYIMKPFSAEEIELLVQKALENKRLREENAKLKKLVEVNSEERHMIFVSDKMREVYRLVEKVAKTDATVLICGETGVGKEIVASLIHKLSKRRNCPYVKLNCAAIPESLLESELFGYEKGAFTGAVKSKMGRFELADGGTILLDEISEMPLFLQAKLLRVLQEKEIDRLGAKSPKKIDVRVIATTNRDLAKEVEESRFRQDLFFRLAVMPIYIPPLRERKEDILPLSFFFLERFSKKMGKRITGFAPQSVELLKEYNWPGNVRELENCIHRAVILCEQEEILPEHIILAYDLKKGGILV